MHPGRLTHYHEGLYTTKGTRYIMVIHQLSISVYSFKFVLIRFLSILDFIRRSLENYYKNYDAFYQIFLIWRVQKRYFANNCFFLHLLTHNQYSSFYWLFNDWNTFLYATELEMYYLFSTYSTRSHLIQFYTWVLVFFPRISKSTP